MQIAFDSLIERVNGPKISETAVEVLRRAVRSKPEELLPYLLEELYSTKDSIYYFKACSLLEPEYLTREFTICVLYRLSIVLREEQEPECLQVYEKALLGLPRYPGAFSFFTNETRSAFTLQEARLYFKESLSSPAALKTPSELKYSVAAATLSDIEFLFKEALKLLEEASDIDDFCTCLILTGELLRRLSKGVTVYAIKEEIMTSFIQPFREELAKILVSAREASDSGQELLTRLLSVIFYYRIVEYMPPAFIESIHGYLQLSALKLIEQFTANRVQFSKTLLLESLSLQASPILEKCICSDYAATDIIRGLENNILTIAAFLVNHQTINYIGTTSGFSTAIMAAQEASSKVGDSFPLYISGSQSRNMINALLELLLSTGPDEQSSVRIAHSICLMAFYNPDFIIEALKSVFHNAKLEIACLGVFYELLEVIESSGFTLEYERVLEFIVQCINYELYDLLKFEKDANFKLCQFTQRSMSYFEANKEYKIRVEIPLLRLICKIVKINYEHKLNISPEIVNDYLQLFIDSFCGTFCLDSQFEPDDQLVLELTDMQPELRKELLVLVINTIFFRQFKYNQEQQMLVYSLELKLYYGCFVLLNLIIHEEANHYTLIHHMVGFGIEFVDVIALSMMLLLCVGIEKNQCRFPVVGLREQVLSTLNYLVQIPLQEEEYGALENFFGTEIAKYGCFKSAINDYSDEDRFLIEIIITSSRLFITKLLQLFDFAKQSFGIHIVFNEFFPGYKWRSYNPLIELQINTSEYRGTADSAEGSTGDLSHSATISTVVEESEIDTYKQMIESSAFKQNLSSKCDEYIYEIFEFIYELLSLLEPYEGYRFYLRCYQAQLLQCTNIVIEREFEYKLSILGLIRRLEGLSFDYEDLVEENGWVSGASGAAGGADGTFGTFDVFGTSGTSSGGSGAVVDEFMDVLINCVSLQNKQLKLTDLAYLIDAISAASLQMILVLLMRIEATNQLKQAQCLQIFQLSIRNPCMMDVLSDVRIRRAARPPELLKARNPQSLELLSIVILKFRQFQHLKIYKQLCYACFHLLGLAEVLVECKELDQRKADIYIIDIIQFLLQNSSFGPVQSLGGPVEEGESAFAEAVAHAENGGEISNNNAISIAQSDGFSALMHYFQKNDQIEHFAAFSINSRYAETLSAAGLNDLTRTELDLQGGLAQCVHLWNQTVWQFAEITANFRLEFGIKALMARKALTILHIVQENPEIRPIYNSEIQPRLLLLIMAVIESDFTSKTYIYIIEVFIGLFAMCKNVEEIKFVEKMLLQIQELSISLFHMPKETARYLVCDNQPFGSLGTSAVQICELINYGEHEAAIYYIEQALCAQEISLPELRSNKELDILVAHLMEWADEHKHVVGLISLLMDQDQRYYNTVLPTVSLLITCNSEMFAKRRDYAHVVMSHAVFLYENVEQPRRKDFVTAFMDLFKLHPDIFCALVVHYATSNIYLLSEMVADIMSCQGMEEFLSKLFELLRECFVHAVFCSRERRCFDFNILLVYVNFLESLAIHGAYKELLLRVISEGEKVLVALIVIFVRVFLFPESNDNMRENIGFMRGIVDIFTTLIRFVQNNPAQDVIDILEQMQHIENAESIQREIILSQETDLFLKLASSLFSRGILSLSYVESAIVEAYSFNLEEENLVMTHLAYCICTAGAAAHGKSGQFYAKLLEFATYDKHPLYNTFCRVVLTFLAIHENLSLNTVNQYDLKLIDLQFNRAFDLDAFLLKELHTNVTRALIAATTHICQLKNVKEFCQFAVRLTTSNSRETLLQAIQLLSEAAAHERELVREEVMKHIFEIIKRCDGHSQIVFQQLVCRMRGGKDFNEAIVHLLLSSYTVEEIVEELWEKGSSICFRMEILFQMCVERKVSQKAALEAICNALNSGFFAEEELKTAVQILGQIIELDE